MRRMRMERIFMSSRIPPLLAVCGVKNSGKTTYLERLVSEFSRQGLRVAVIKHDGHEFEGDVPGTDSWRMYQAGAWGTAVCSDTQFLLHRRQDDCGEMEKRLEGLAEGFSGAELILVEGMKALSIPKLEIIREGVSKLPVSNPKGRIGILTNVTQDRKEFWRLTGYRLREAEGLYPLDRPGDLAVKLRDILFYREEKPMGKIIAVCTSPRKGTQKINVHQAELIAEHGLKGDAHAGKWHRQVSMLSFEQFEAFRKKGAPIEYGAFGENLLVEGFDFKSLPVGARFRCGDVLLEMTQIGKECHHGCAIRQTMGDCIMPREGVFARVLAGGVIREGDELVQETSGREEDGTWQELPGREKDGAPQETSGREVDGTSQKEFTHFDSAGNALMVDVGSKEDTCREAVARGEIFMSRECFEKVRAGGMKKGDVLGVARIAGIMAAKKTSELIPLCHMVKLTGVTVDFELHPKTASIEVRCCARTVDKTGVEMEALTGVNVALLTIYDMCKAVDRGMRFEGIRLLKKSGGKSGLWEA